MAAPANEALRWKLHVFNSGDGHEGPYSGYPRPELEEAWDGLLGKMNVRFSLEDLKAFDRDEDAVQLPDGSGYAGTLNIYHEIHCVVSLPLSFGLVYFQLMVFSEMDAYAHVPRALLSEPRRCSARREQATFR